MSHTISTGALRDWLADGQELAVIDIRDPAVVGYASPLFATNLPPERLVGEIANFIPRAVVRTVLADGGDGTAEQLAHRLRDAGRPNVFALDGGIPEWVKNGTASLPTFDTPGVDFVLKVRDEKGTPVTSAEELKALRDNGEDVVVLDTRTVAEFTKDHVPGAVSVPGAGRGAVGKDEGRGLLRRPAARHPWCADVDRRGRAQCCHLPP